MEAETRFTKQFAPLPANDVVWVDPRSDAPAEESSLTIGEAAALFGVTARALRFYESKGLLSPSRRGGGRIYEASDRRQLALIRKGQRLGFTLREIAAMAGKDKFGALGPDLRMTREQCENKIELLERKIAGSQEALSELRRLREQLASAPDHNR
jgi:DNA-binding transcriptional MerR regulator